MKLDSVAGDERVRELAEERAREDPTPFEEIVGPIPVRPRDSSTSAFMKE